MTSTPMLEQLLNALTSNVTLSTCCQVGGSRKLSKLFLNNFDFVRVFTKDPDNYPKKVSIEVKQTDDPTEMVGVVDSLYDFAFVSDDFGYDKSMAVFKTLIRNQTPVIICSTKTHSITNTNYSIFRFSDAEDYVMYYLNIITKELENLKDEN